MNLEQLRRFEKLADNIASTLCFDEEGNERPGLNWHDQFLIDFAYSVALLEREACEAVAKAHVCDSRCKDAWGVDKFCKVAIAQEIRARGEEK